jgi:hypothetical protein
MFHACLASDVCIMTLPDAWAVKFVRVRNDSDAVGSDPQTMTSGVKP